MPSGHGKQSAEGGGVPLCVSSQNNSPAQLSSTLNAVPESNLPVEPVSGLKNPAGHKVQALELLSTAKVPGGHSKHVSARTKEYHCW